MTERLDMDVRVNVNDCFAYAALSYCAGRQLVADCEVLDCVDANEEFSNLLSCRHGSCGSYGVEPEFLFSGPLRYQCLISLDGITQTLQDASFPASEAETHNARKRHTAVIALNTRLSTVSPAEAVDVSSVGRSTLTTRRGHRP